MSRSIERRGKQAFIGAVIVVVAYLILLAFGVVQWPNG
jgi:hypothetical protein